MVPHGPFSHSRLECFRKCPRQFCFRYVDRLPPRRRGIEAFMGSRVHEALEYLYGELAGERPVELAALLDHYHTAWDQSFGEDVHIVKEDKHADYYRARGAACLEAYYQRYAPFGDAGQTLGLELLVTFCLNEDERYPVRGFVDRLVRGEDDVLEIHDYKTSQRLPGPADLAADGQLSLYQVGLGQVFPGQRGVRLIWHYLVHDRRLELTRTPAELEALCDHTRRTIEAIQAERRFEPRPSVLCRWCSYHDLCAEGRRRVESKQSTSRHEDGFVWRYASIKQAVRDADPDSEAGILHREAELLRNSICDYVWRTGRTVLEGRLGRLIVRPPEDARGDAAWQMRLES